jgi:hypothetical protein
MDKNLGKLPQIFPKLTSVDKGKKEISFTFPITLAKDNFNLVRALLHVVTSLNTVPSPFILRWISVADPLFLQSYRFCL